MRSNLIPCPDCPDGFVQVTGGDGEPEWAFCPTCEGEAWLDPEHWTLEDREQADQIRRDLSSFSGIILLILQSLLWLGGGA